MFRAFCVAYAMEGSTFLEAANISLSKTFPAGVNRAEKAYQCIVYIPMRSRIASNLRVYL